MTQHESSEEIREDIQETRRDMSRKIDAIQDHLSPEKLKAQAGAVVNEFATATADSITEYLRGNSSELVKTVADSMKRNPVPAALVGLGLGWLLLESYGSDTNARVRYPLAKVEGAPAYDYRNSNNQPPAYGTPRNGAADGPDGQSLVGKIGETVSDAAHAVEAKAQEWTQQAGERVHHAANQAQRVRDEARVQGNLAAMDARDQVADWDQQARRYAQQTGSQAQGYAHETANYVNQAVEGAYDSTRQATRQIGSYAQQMGSQARDYRYEAGHQIQSTIEENPLSFGTIALAVGAAIGLMLPQTRRENRWLGPTSDQVWDTTKAAASDVMQRTQEVVEEVRPELEQTVQKVASDLEQTGRNVVEELKQTGSTALHEAQDALHHAQDVATEKTAELQEDVKKEIGEKGNQPV